MEGECFVFRIRAYDGKGYKYGIYNRDHDKWALNIVFKGTYEQCKIKQQELINT